MVDEALRDPISVKMLAVNGTTLMSRFDVEPGPRIGWILNALLEDVLDDPKKNSTSYLEGRAKELLMLPEDELKAFGEAGKKKREEAEEVDLQKILKKHHLC